MMRRLLSSNTIRIPLLVLYGLVLFAVFLRYTLPLQQILQTQADRALAGAPIRLEFGDADLGFGGSLNLDSLEIQAAGSLVDLAVLPPEERGNTDPIQLLRLENIVVDLGLAALLKKQARIVLDAGLYNGSTHGEVVLTPESITLNQELNDVRMGLMKSLPYYAPANIDGNLSGKLENVTVAFDDLGLPALNTLSGTFAPNITDVKLSKMPLMGDKTVTFKAIRGFVDASDGIVRFNQFKMNGPEISGELRGAITLNKIAERSTLDLYVNLNPKDKELGDLIDTLLKMQPGKRIQRKPDGRLNLHIRGRLSRPQLM